MSFLRTKQSSANGGHAFFDQIALDLPEPQRRHDEPVNFLGLSRFVVIHHVRRRCAQMFAQFFWSASELRRSPPGALRSCYSHQRFPPRESLLFVNSHHHVRLVVKIVRQLVDRIFLPELNSRIAQTARRIVMTATQNLKARRVILDPLSDCGRYAALLSPTGAARRPCCPSQPLDAVQPGIAHRTRAALPRQLARSQRCLLPCLVQAARSKVRCEKIIEDAARPTDCRDEPRNKVPLARSPPMRSPRHGAHAKCDHYFSSSACRNACLGEIGCGFLL